MGTSTKPVVESSIFYTPAPPVWPHRHRNVHDSTLYGKNVEPVFRTDIQQEELEKDASWRTGSASQDIRTPNSRQKGRVKLATTTHFPYPTDPPDDFVQEYHPQSNDHTPRIMYHTLPPDEPEVAPRVRNCSEVLYNYNPSQHYIVGWRNATMDDLGILPNKGIINIYYILL